MQFSGAMTALVTPFRNNAVDEAAYRDFIENQITEGIHGLVPCGTTGESATLTHEEHERVIEICIDQARGRVPVLAGAGSNNTAEAIRLARFAKKAGADGALLITPYYNKPTRGLVPALQCHCRGCGSAAGALQRAGPYGLQYAASGTEPSCPRFFPYCGRQGSHRGYGPGQSGTGILP